MTEKQQRFPRQKLLAQTVVLEQTLAHWCGITAIKLNEARDHGYGDRVIDGFEERYSALNEARQQLADARSTLFYCR
jgi:hypothetical protein